jgi:hypothetical protein
LPQAPPQRATTTPPPQLHRVRQNEVSKHPPNPLLNNLLNQKQPSEPLTCSADDKIAAIEGAMEWIKRDLQGFQASLQYAREALKDQPKVELGSPNAGIGIVVNPGVNVAKGSAAAGAPAKPARRSKRSEVDDETESPKMTLVAITEV